MKWTVRYFDNDADEGLDAVLSVDDRGEALVAISGRPPLHMAAGQFYLRDGSYGDGWMELGCIPGHDGKLLVIGAETCDSVADHMPQLALRAPRETRAAGMALVVVSALLVLTASITLIGAKFTG
ncbi:hypothetical protein [Gimibacter soli]|uniref:Uncharacterized protein n=1 Tax=Gimibacter soli TaxID=3024400 RepID=A0AAE9XR35_9PROT|nr:hypothetical protein [Gimibacter soli]WCL54664.1 hypothetical protein PH603_02680 [Gimibacter soli]